MPDGTPIDRAKLLSLSYLGRRTRDQVKEWRSEDGEHHKATVDELGTTVTQHARGDRQDVHARPKAIRKHVEELR